MSGKRFSYTASLPEKSIPERRYPHLLPGRVLSQLCVPVYEARPAAANDRVDNRGVLPHPGPAIGVAGYGEGKGYPLAHRSGLPAQVLWIRREGAKR